jgi:hypothetical protein
MSNEQFWRALSNDASLKHYSGTLGEESFAGVSEEARRIRGRYSKLWLCVVNVDVAVVAMA